MRRAAARPAALWRRALACARDGRRVRTSAARYARRRAILAGLHRATAVRSYARALGVRQAGPARGRHRGRASAISTRRRACFARHSSGARGGTHLEARYEKLAEAIRDTLAEAITRAAVPCATSSRATARAAISSSTTSSTIGRRAVPGLRHAGPADRAGAALDVLLPDMPALNRRYAACRRNEGCAPTKTESRALRGPTEAQAPLRDLCSSRAFVACPRRVRSSSLGSPVSIRSGPSTDPLQQRTKSTLLYDDLLVEIPVRDAPQDRNCAGRHARGDTRPGKHPRIDGRALRADVDRVATRARPS